MNYLALDTATEACSAALWLNGQLLARCETVGRDHTQRLLPLVQGLMAEAGLAFSQLDGYICGLGPGSFAGVRIACAFTKGLALAHDRPAVGLSSLQLLAAQAERLHGPSPVYAAIDARMGEVYWQAFNPGVLALGDAVVCPPAQLPAAALPPLAIALGTGWHSYAETLLGHCPPPLHTLPQALPEARDALALALPIFAKGEAVSAETLAPLYLRNNVALTLAQQQARKAG